jgi:predicted branched-subunit amino acid permease
MNSMHNVPQKSGSPRWGLDGLRYGVRHTLALLPGTAVFGMAFGTVAAQKGLTLTETTVMSAFVFSGAAQMVAMEIWSNPITIGTILTLAASSFVVGLRMVLMGMSLHPWLGHLPAIQIYPPLLLNTDSTWMIALRYREEGGNDPSVVLGAGLALWAMWVPSCITGYVVGNLIANPQRYGLDLILPIFFVAMLVPLWRGARGAIPWAIAGATALLVQFLIPGYWYIVIGALAGAISGGFIDEQE